MSSAAVRHLLFDLAGVTCGFDSTPLKRLAAEAYAKPGVNECT